MNQQYILYGDGWEQNSLADAVWSYGKSSFNISDIKILTLTFNKPADNPASQIKVFRNNIEAVYPVMDGENTLSIYCLGISTVLLDIETITRNNAPIGILLKRIDILTKDSRVFSNIDLFSLAAVSGHDCVYTRNKTEAIGEAVLPPIINEKNRVVMCIPCGRRRNLEILFPYIFRDRHLLDEVQLWINTNDPDDLRYIHYISSQLPNFLKCIEHPDVINGIRQINPRNIGASVSKFFVNCTDVNTIYIKCDDDICFIEEGAIKGLIDFRKKNPIPLIIYPNCVNNSIMSYLHQRMGCISYKYGACNWTSGDKVSWGNPKTAEEIHNKFLQNCEDGSLDIYKFKRWELLDYPKVSIGFIVFFGEDLAPIGGRIQYDEEFLSVILPEALNRPNVIYGEKLVSHFAYIMQREYLENSTNLLDTYKRLMRRLLYNPIGELEHKSIYQQNNFSKIKINLPNTNRVGYFNSCIFQKNGQKYLCARKDESFVDRQEGRDAFAFEDLKSSSLAMFKLDSSYQPIEEIQLNIIPEFENEQLEDPRVLVLDDGILISCSSRKYKSIDCQIKLIMLDNNFQYIKSIHPIYDGNADKIESNTKIHKNWGWFMYDNKPHAVVRVAPFTIIEFDFNGIAQKEYIHAGFDWKYGDCKGGTNPIFVDGKFKAAFHSAEHRFATNNKQLLIYHWGEYEFDIKPPFAPRYYSKIPILSANMKDAASIEHRLVVFPMGHIIENGKFITSFGLNDRDTYVMEQPSS